MAWRFYNKKELTKLLGVTEDHFHTSIKKQIRGDFRNELKERGFNNPDIWLNAEHQMALVDPRNSNNFLETEVSIFDYIVKDGKD